MSKNEKVPANQIQQHSRRMVHLGEVEFCAVKNQMPTIASLVCTA